MVFLISSRWVSLRIVKTMITFPPLVPSFALATSPMNRSVTFSFTVGLVMSILAVLTVMQVRLQIMDSVADLRETRDLEVATSLIARQVVDFEAAYRGYLVTRSEWALDPIVAARQTFPDNLSRLQDMADREPDFRGAIQRILRTARDAAADIQTAVEIERSRADPPEERNRRLLAIHDRTQAVRQEVSTFHDALHQQIQERRKSMGWIISLLLAAIIALLAGIVISSVALARELRRQHVAAFEAGRRTADTLSSLTANLDLSRLETELVNQRLALAIQSARAAVFTIDRSGKIHWVTASPESPLTHSEGEPSLEERVSPNFREAFRRKLEEAFTRDQLVIVDLAMRSDPETSSLGERWLRFNILPAGKDEELVLGSAIDITDIRRRENANILLMRELSHRSKNLLAIVQAMARQTARAAGNLHTFQERFSQRLRALAASHDLLVTNNYAGAEIRDVIRSQLADLSQHVGGRITLDGRNLFMQPEAAQTFGMAIHELASNARLFGALSNETGSIAIRWQDGEEDGVPRLIVDWAETGPPRRDLQPRPGFGTTLIEVNLPRALNGHVELVHDPAGTRCRMTLDRTLVEERAAGPDVARAT